MVCHYPINFQNLFTDMICKIGDGVGPSESKLEGSYTIQECINAVKESYPNANGATISSPCKEGTCKCYAEFGMTGWNFERTDYQSCMFKEGNICAL